MRSILFSVLCILSFASSAFSALAFGERFGMIPPVREECTAATYQLHVNKHRVDVALGPLRIWAGGNGFIIVTFGFHKGVIFPGNEGPIQAGDSILIVLFADTVDRDKVIEFISNAPNLGHEAILNDPDLNKAPIFMFGFKIGHDTSTRNHALPARKRRGVDLSQSAKRQAIAEPELVFSWYRNHNPLNNTNLSIGETTVQMIASNLITSTVLGEIENQTVKLRVSGGAVALVARRGKVKARNLVSSRQRYESYSIIPLCEQPAEKVLKAHPGDLVFMFVPLTANNNLETLKVVPGLVQNIEANWNPFIKQCCKDQVAVAVFSVKAQ